jgi:hypothetical protein
VLRAAVPIDEFVALVSPPLRKRTLSLLSHTFDDGRFPIEVTIGADEQVDVVRTEFVNAGGYHGTGECRFWDAGEPVRVTFPSAAETTPYPRVTDVTGMYLP